MTVREFAQKISELSDEDIRKILARAALTVAKKC